MSRLRASLSGRWLSQVPESLGEFRRDLRRKLRIVGLCEQPWAEGADVAEGDAEHCACCRRLSRAKSAVVAATAPLAFLLVILREVTSLVG